MNSHPNMDLVICGRSQDSFLWPFGRKWVCDFSLSSLNQIAQQNRVSSGADAFLFWSLDFSILDPKRCLLLLKQPIDVWHTGLLLGMRGLPGAIDFVQPTWMLNRDPEGNKVVTSWRLSLRACLIRTEVIRKMGWLRPEFKTLEAATLELGHRWISRGVLMRHVPELIVGGQKTEGRGQRTDGRRQTAEGSQPTTEDRKNGKALAVDRGLLTMDGSQPTGIPFEDELRFIQCRFGKKWVWWTLFRAIATRSKSLRAAVDAVRIVLSEKKYQEPEPYRGYSAQRIAYNVQSTEYGEQIKYSGAKVSVLIPTLNRYTYLEKLLENLRLQTVKPLEIIIVDQSHKEIRDPKFYQKFEDLPLQLIYQDEPGQCSSRNAGIQASKGEYILFLDDDDEVQPDLIAKHLATLEKFKCEVSSGVAREAGAGDLPENFRYLRQSDVFPTNNTMIRKKVLERSGLFDLAFNRKQRADGDLGVRVYLSGAQMILNPDISVLHHHASEGGLRQHKARVITYAASRQSLWKRQLPSDSEIYLGLKYFSESQVREFLWLKVLGTFSVRGGRIKKILKIVFALASLPWILVEIKKRVLSAREMQACLNSDCR